MNIIRSEQPAQSGHEVTRNSAHLLKIASPVVLGVVALEAVVSIVKRWPHAFGGAGDPDHMVADFASTGTALAPPLVVIVLLALAVVGLQFPGRWRFWATMLLVLLSVVMTVGALGELLTSPVADIPPAIRWGGGVFGVAMSVLLLALSIGSLAASRRAARRPSTQAASGP